MSDARSASGEGSSHPDTPAANNAVAAPVHKNYPSIQPIYRNGQTEWITTARPEGGRVAYNQWEFKARGGVFHEAPHPEFVKMDQDQRIAFNSAGAAQPFFKNNIINPPPPLPPLPPTPAPKAPAQGTCERCHQQPRPVKIITTGDIGKVTLCWLCLVEATGVADEATQRKWNEAKAP